MDKPSRIGHSSLVNRKDRQPSFSDVVAAVRSRPVTPATIVAGIGRDGLFTDVSGRRYELIDESLSASDALAAVSSTDVVVVDNCGCGGDCGFEWLDKPQIAGLVALGEPVIRSKRGGLSRVSTWESVDGTRLTLISGNVVWGPLIVGWP